LMNDNSFSIEKWKYSRFNNLYLIY
jgi:hypothetical protein